MWKGQRFVSSCLSAVDGDDTCLCCRDQTWFGALAYAKRSLRGRGALSRDFNIVTLWVKELMLFGVEFWLKIISKGLLILCALKLQKHFSNIYVCGGRGGISVPLNFRPRLSQRLFVTPLNSSRSVLAPAGGSGSFLSFLCNCICFHEPSYRGRPKDSPSCCTAWLCGSLRWHSDCHSTTSTFHFAKMENPSSPWALPRLSLWNVVLLCLPSWIWSLLEKFLLLPPFTSQLWARS